MLSEFFCEKSRVTTMFVSTAIIFIDFLTIFVSAEPTVIVNTTYGPVQGEILTSVNSIEYSAFKGIRYAKAPIGYLRFKPPVPVDKWTEVLNATIEGDDCTQSDYSTNVLTGSEDCLFINVFTPVTDLESTSTNLKAVMVWIYGGGFTTGTSSSVMYKPDYLLEKDVVYVSLNYRLGALGFLNLNHPNATGNAGLKDQVLGLKWVQANIAKFGGNPKNVTIFGQSAGSVSVGYQVLSEAAAGLFHGAISMSGVPLNPWAFQTSDKAMSQAVKLAANLGTITLNKATLLRTFYSASAAEIVTATAQISKVIPPFVPTLEDAKIATDVFLSQCSVTKYNNGNYNKVPQIMGYTDQETIAFFGAVEPFVEVVTYAIKFANQIGLILPPGLHAVQILMNLGINFFDTLTTDTLNAVISETTDLLFVAQIDQTQKIFASNRADAVFYYHLSFYTNTSIHNVLLNNTLQGAGHADDLAYIFYFPNVNYSANAAVTLMIDRYTTMWTNFAKYGNPTPYWANDGDLTVQWPNSGPSGVSLDIGNALSVVSRVTSVDVSLIELLSRPLLGAANGCRRFLFGDLLLGRF